MYNPETAKQNILLTLKTGYISVDMEGGDLVKDTPVEISAVRYSPDGERLGSITVVRDKTSLTPRGGAAGMNGKSTFLRDKEITELIDFIGDLPLIGHSISTHDLPILNYYSRAVRSRGLGNPVIDTYSLARTLFPRSRYFSLRVLTQELGIGGLVYHKSEADCESTSRLYCRLMRKYLDMPEAERDAALHRGLYWSKKTSGFEECKDGQAAWGPLRSPSEQGRPAEDKKAVIHTWLQDYIMRLVLETDHEIPQKAQKFAAKKTKGLGHAGSNMLFMENASPKMLDRLKKILISSGFSTSVSGEDAKSEILPFCCPDLPKFLGGPNEAVLRTWEFGGKTRLCVEFRLGSEMPENLAQLITAKLRCLCLAGERTILAEDASPGEIKGIVNLLAAYDYCVYRAFDKKRAAALISIAHENTKKDRKKCRIDYAALPLYDSKSVRRHKSAVICMWRSDGKTRLSLETSGALPRTALLLPGAEPECSWHTGAWLLFAEDISLKAYDILSNALISSGYDIYRGEENGLAVATQPKADEIEKAHFIKYSSIPPYDPIEADESKLAVLRMWDCGGKTNLILKTSCAIPESVKNLAEETPHCGWHIGPRELLVDAIPLKTFAILVNLLASSGFRVYRDVENELSEPLPPDGETAENKIESAPHEELSGLEKEPAAIDKPAYIPPEKAYPAETRLPAGKTAERKIESAAPKDQAGLEKEPAAIDKPAYIPPEKEYPAETRLPAGKTAERKIESAAPKDQAGLEKEPAGYDKPAYIPPEKAYPAELSKPDSESAKKGKIIRHIDYNSLPIYNPQAARKRRKAVFHMWRRGSCTRLCVETHHYRITRGFAEFLERAVPDCSWECSGNILLVENVTQEALDRIARIFRKASFAINRTADVSAPPLPAGSSVSLGSDSQKSEEVSAEFASLPPYDPKETDQSGTAVLHQWRLGTRTRLCVEMADAISRELADRITAVIPDRRWHYCNKLLLSPSIKHEAFITIVKMLTSSGFRVYRDAENELPEPLLPAGTIAEKEIVNTASNDRGSIKNPPAAKQAANCPDGKEISAELSKPDGESAKKGKIIRHIDYNSLPIYNPQAARKRRKAVFHIWRRGSCTRLCAEASCTIPNEPIEQQADAMFNAGLHLDKNMLLVENSSSEVFDSIANTFISSGFDLYRFADSGAEPLPTGCAVCPEAEEVSAEFASLPPYHSADSSAAPISTDSAVCLEDWEIPAELALLPYYAPKPAPPRQFAILRLWRFGENTRLCLEMSDAISRGFAKALAHVTPKCGWLYCNKLLLAANISPLGFELLTAALKVSGCAVCRDDEKELSAFLPAGSESGKTGTENLPSYSS